MTGRRAVAGLAAMAALASGCGGSGDADATPVDRVLVVTLPGVSWRDVDAGFMPNLRQFSDDAAVGNLATRIGRSPADTAGAYLTMGAGSRALPPRREAGAAVADGERLVGTEASDLLARRLGHVPDGIAYLPAGPTIDRNDATVYGADVGLLGEELAGNDVERAVIANADRLDELGGEEPPGAAVRLGREAVTLLMDRDGLLPAGRVDGGLLLRDAESPFGVRLDPVAVVAAAHESLADADRAVVVVEASDLHRAASYRTEVTDPKRRAMRARALSDADELLGQLLAEIDPARDAVLVVGVPTSPGAPDLAAVALRTPTTAAGLLRSATTGRDGYVQLADVAPTILALLGEDHPRQIEGRPFTVTGNGGDGRVATLARDTREADFRDAMVPGVTIAFIAVLALLLGVAVRRARYPGANQGRLLAFAAHTVLGAAAATFLVGAEWASPTTAVVYTALVVAIGLAVGAVASVAERQWPGSGAVVALGSVLAVVSLDVALGATLQINTVFGYSVAVAGRFAGLGNLAFAIFSAAAVLLAGVLADRYGERGVRAGIAVLVAVVLIDGLPPLGADVGGSLSMVPAFGLTALVLAGRPLRWLHLLAAGATAVVVTLTFAFVDLARPESSQTHLARFARQVVDGRWAIMADTLDRRFRASFGSLGAVAWGLVIATVAAATLYAVLVDRGRFPTAVQRRAWPRPPVAVGTGLGVLALLGWTANDSSFAVPATMLIVVVPVLVDRMVRPA